MKRIDAHQHFWKADPVRANWINEEMKSVQRDFFPKDLWPLLYENGFDGCVAVQSGQSEKETDFLISLAKQHKFIRGVVGWVDLQADNIAERLEWYKSFTVLKGFRHILQSDWQRDLMLQPTFKRGIAALHRYGFTYDLLIFPDQLKFSAQLAASFPDQKFVIDHIARPNIRHRDIAGWKANINKLALHRNVYCKISGMIAESDRNGHSKADFRPYIDEIVNAFGMDRVMFGSDWPACQAGASYEEMTRIVLDYFSTFSREEQELFFVWNAINFYGL